MQTNWLRKLLSAFISFYISTIKVLHFKFVTCNFKLVSTVKKAMKVCESEHLDASQYEGLKVK